MEPKNEPEDSEAPTPAPATLPDVPEQPSLEDELIPQIRRLEAYHARLEETVTNLILLMESAASSQGHARLARSLNDLRTGMSE